VWLEGLAYMGAHVYIGHWTEALHININTHGEEERGSGKGNGNEEEEPRTSGVRVG
jgi:hypothetical protein